VHHICKRLANWQAFFVFGVGTRPFGLPAKIRDFRAPATRSGASLNTWLTPSWVHHICKASFL